jgi:broad specificity phosphatase PhoE
MQRAMTSEKASYPSVIYLVRHGETAWNVSGRQQGRLDSELTARGVVQARSAGRVLRRVLPDVLDAVVQTSPLGRARQTAALICAELDIPTSDITVSTLLIAVTHEMTSRTIQGAYAALSPLETLNRSHRHGQIYRLAGGRVTEVSAD